MTELEILMLQSSSNQATGTYQIAMAFSIWVAFRVARTVGENHNSNLAAKLAGSIFGLATLFFFNMTYAFWSFNMAATGHRLANLQASGVEISALSQQYVANSGAADAMPQFSLVPSDPIAILLQLSILVLILVPIWGPKAD
jgi:hypothetical protein